MNKLIITSGYYEILHAGHVECLQKAKELGDYLIVIINNDTQSFNKKGKVVMNQDSRRYIISNIKGVDKTVISIDTDATVCKTLKYLASFYKKLYDEIIFAKGGDRLASEIPESKVCKEMNIKIIDGLGDKIDSSSRYYQNYNG
jgi:D-beta-D-heptose 7-phosphate kinase/D-beta-D-heptose 1-phosphate adenosyltransferase